MTETARPFRFRSARGFLWTTGGLVAAGLLLGLLRVPLTGLAVGTALRLAGAGDCRFTVSSASPWLVVLENVAFRIKNQPFAARRIEFRRDHWWQLSAGAVQVDGARVPLTLDGSDVNPFDWAGYAGQGEAITAPGLLRLPVDGLMVRGTVELTVAAVTPRTVAVELVAHRFRHEVWQLTWRARGEGITAKGDGRYEPAGDRLDYRIELENLELQTWQDYLQRVVLLPGGSWEMAGKVSARIEGNYAGRRRGASGLVHWREGRLALPWRKVEFAHLGADFEFTNFLHCQSRPGSVRIGEFRAGGISARDLSLTLTFAGFDRVEVGRATLHAFGGVLAAEPFTFFPAHQELDVVLEAQGLQAEQILAATSNVPARAGGRLDGRLPLHVDSGGMRLGTGWLQLGPGESGWIQLHAVGLITGGLIPGEPGFALGRKLENGLRVRARELRLDLRPAVGPPGLTARLQVVGTAENGGAEPVAFDAAIFSPVEAMLNLDLDPARIP